MTIHTPHTHNCAATGCQKQVPLNLLMCMAHWKLVPEPVKREVLAAWRAWNRDVLNVDKAVAHRAAVERAVEAVQAKQVRKIADKKKAVADLFGINGM